MATAATPELKVFYCYAREDQQYREKLDRHLANLKRRYHLKTWFDRLSATILNCSMPQTTRLLQSVPRARPCGLSGVIGPA